VVEGRVIENGIEVHRQRVYLISAMGVYWLINDADIDEMSG
jgi:hypothetical protein